MPIKFDTSPIESTAPKTANEFVIESLTFDFLYSHDHTGEYIEGEGGELTPVVRPIKLSIESLALLDGRIVDQKDETVPDALLGQIMQSEDGRAVYAMLKELAYTALRTMKNKPSGIIE